MKQVLLGRSGVEVRDVPAPANEAGHILVRTSRSCISVGTEMSGVRESDKAIWRRALERPHQVKKLAELVLRDGIASTQALVKTKLAEAHPIGYSLTGRVLNVGDGIGDLRVGDRVACAGAQHAHHAEIVRVPRNLCVPVPEGVDDAAAATVTLGAIALQGLRRLAPTLGETFVVIGLGLVGQLTVQLLKASGARVVASDLDANRVREARPFADVVLQPGDSDAIEQVIRLTDGQGADGVIITAASSSDEVIATACRMCRRKGRVVIVGDVGLDIQRADIYAKELDVLISTSYGPGRYDRRYEEEGLDYPLGYVRWTENRNMAEYLRLLAERRVSLNHANAPSFSIERAGEAYETLGASEDRPLLAWLTYPEVPDQEARRVIEVRSSPRQAAGSLRLALIGAGGFAKSMLLPIIQGMPEKIQLDLVVSRRGHEADTLARQYQAARSSTDVDAAIADPAVEAVMIATRHDSHADLALRALRAGKHVFVEKPLCLTLDELSEIEAFFKNGDGPKPVLMTGFNRRFSPYAQALKDGLAGRSNPMVINYRVNAGHIPRDHWVHGAAGGGRNLGEACHFYDFFTFLTEAAVTKVSATALRPATDYYAASDNFVASVAFADGSIASLTYTALGSPDHPKELIDVYSDGRVFSIHDFKSLRADGGDLKPVKSRVQEKGHKLEIIAFVEAIQSGGAWPLSLWEQVQATRIALEVETAISAATTAGPAESEA